MTTDKLAQILDEHREYLRTEFGVEKIGVFGSYRKGTENQDSDIDLVIEFSRQIGFRFIELADYLEELFGVPVDILTPGGVQGIRVPQVATEIQESLINV